MSHPPSSPPPEPFTASLERMNRFQEPEARALIADLGLAPGSRGLDVGCGVGLYALWLAEAVGPQGRVTGIEPGAERVEAARARVGMAAAGDRVELRTGDATALDFRDASFDWVWCGDVLHHIPDTQGALKQMIRVLRPGGLLVIKESQALPAMFLPGHPELEKRLQQAEIARSRDEAGERSFQERRQRTPESLREAGRSPVEDLGCQCHVPFGRDPIRDGADVVVHAEDLLEDDHRRIGAGGRGARQIRGHREGADGNFHTFVDDLH